MVGCFKIVVHHNKLSCSLVSHRENIIRVLCVVPGRLLSLCFYDEDRLYGGTANSQIVGWSLPSGISTVKMTVDQSTKIVTSQHKRTVEKTPTLIWTLVALPRHRLIASGDSSGAVYLWSVDVHTVLKMFCPVSHFFFSLKTLCAAIFVCFFLAPNGCTTFGCMPCNAQLHFQRRFRRQVVDHCIRSFNGMYVALPSLLLLCNHPCITFPAPLF